MKEKLKDHFARYKNADVAYVSGGIIFLTESAAESYGKGPVTKITRAAVEKLDPEEKPLNDPSKGIQALTPEQVNAMDYNEMKAAVKERGLKVGNQNKETLRAALLAVAKKED
ncbi:MAG: hypothetical protein IJQ32_03425 [Paludibacteraceae bacterium]|nr:hypothetical protein [Paludibacteraceae bacterium]